MWLRAVRLSETGIAFARSYVRGVETAIAFVGRRGGPVETGVAFAGEKWAFLLCFSVAVVLSVSTVAVQGYAVVIGVSC